MVFSHEKFFITVFSQIVIGAIDFYFIKRWEDNHEKELANISGMIETVKQGKELPQLALLDKWNKKSNVLST